MKRYLFVLFTSLLLASCAKKEPRTDYVINGNAKDVYNGIRVYLNEVPSKGRPKKLDTAIVINETFKFQGKVDMPELFYISMNGVRGQFPIMIENSEMTLTLNKDNLYESILKGSESHNLMEEFKSEFDSLALKMRTLNKDYSEALLSGISSNSEKLETQLQNLQAEMQQYPFDFIKEHKDSPVSIQILKKQMSVRGVDINKVVEVYDMLPAKHRESNSGKLLGHEIRKLKSQIEAEKLTQIGAIAPEFSAPTPSGELLALNDVVKKGKVTIIDFWAAWCGPCRRENPNVVRIYEKYHEKGLEIIGVGLDGRRGQQNPKEAWTKAIKDDNLTWHQVSNLNYFGEIAKSYNVNAIPAMFVLDKEGKIIAKNLRGKKLEAKIAELLD